LPFWSPCGSTGCRGGRPRALQSLFRVPHPSPQRERRSRAKTKSRVGYRLTLSFRARRRPRFAADFLIGGRGIPPSSSPHSAPRLPCPSAVIPSPAPTPFVGNEGEGSAFSFQTPVRRAPRAGWPTEGPAVACLCPAPRRPCPSAVIPSAGARGICSFVSDARAESTGCRVPHPSLQRERRSRAKTKSRVGVALRCHSEPAAGRGSQPTFSSAGEESLLLLPRTPPHAFLAQALSSRAQPRRLLSGMRARDLQLPFWSPCGEQRVPGWPTEGSAVAFSGAHPSLQRERRSRAKTKSRVGYRPTLSF
jgi:hypothetical protein